MLVLNRYPGQTIYLDASEGLIIVNLISIWDNVARIGIEAPREINIRRDNAMRKLIRRNERE